MKTALGTIIIQLAKNWNLELANWWKTRLNCLQDRWNTTPSFMPKIFLNIQVWKQFYPFGVFTELDEEPTQGELSVTIMALSNGRAQSKDDIPAEIFKENKDVVLPQLHALLLQCWQQCEIPHKICTLYKNKVNCNSYRKILFILWRVRSSLGSFWNACKSWLIANCQRHSLDLGLVDQTLI